MDDDRIKRMNRRRMKRPSTYRHLTAFDVTVNGAVAISVDTLVDPPGR